MSAWAKNSTRARTAKSQTTLLGGRGFLRPEGQGAATLTSNQKQTQGTVGCGLAGRMRGQCFGIWEYGTVAAGCDPTGQADQERRIQKKNGKSSDGLAFMKMQRFD